MLPRSCAAVAVVLGLLAGSVPVAPVLAQSPAPASAPAPSRLDEIIARGKLRVGTTGDYRPFTYFDKQTGKFEGYDIDMAVALAKAMGVEAEFVQTSWPDLSKDFSADKFDIAMGGFRSP
jgi:cyclohexadienyl dehydratase